MGQFIDFYLPYQETNPSNEPEQALVIVKKAEALLNAGSTLVAITYSANYGQTLDIHQTYESGGWDSKIIGKNQAKVMTQMELLLGGDYSHLQRKLQIAPISTMLYPPGAKPPIDYVQDDLDYIKSLLDNGTDILGWINQVSKPRYAVGGGVAGGLPPKIDTLIQTTLSQYAKDYPSK